MHKVQDVGYAITWCECVTCFKVSHFKLYFEIWFKVPMMMVIFETLIKRFLWELELPLLTSTEGMVKFALLFMEMVLQIKAR